MITTLCSEFVLVNEATQDVVTSHASEVGERSGRIRRRVRRSEAEAAVRPARIVVGDVLAEDVLEVTPTENERPVQALPPDGPHPTLGEGVRSRRPERGEDDPMPSAAKTASKLLVYLESRSRMRRRNGPRPVRSKERFRACWVTQAEWGCLVAPAMWTRLVWTSITKNT